MSALSLRVLGLVAVSSWLAVGCSSENKILPGAACLLNTDCHDPLVCTMDKCHDACHGSADCSGGQRCVRTDKGTVCQLPAETSCAATGTCGGALVCASDLSCRSGCQSPADCAVNQLCVTGVCADPPELNNNGQLPQLNKDAGTDGPPVATGGAGGESGLGGESGSSGGVGDAAAAGSGGGMDGGSGLGGASGSSGGARDGAVVGGAGDGALAGGAGGRDGGIGPGGAGGSSGGAAAGAGGTATRDAGASDLPADRPADTVVVPDTKATTPDTAVLTSGDGGASTVLTGCGKVTTKRYFCDDFESGLDNWHYATLGWGLTTTTFQSPNNSVTDSPNGNYPAGDKSDITMVSSVDLTGAAKPVVAFWHKLSLNSCEAYPSCDSYCSDVTYVDASSDGGNTWTVVTSFNCTNNTTVWSFQQLSLASYAGKKIKLRFRLNGSDGGADGWYIDDVEIREAVQPSAGGSDGGSQNAVSAESTGCDGAPVAGRYLCEDFETATDLNTNWLVATNGWNTVDSTYQSPIHSVTDSPSGNYPAGAKSDMTMISSVDLTGAVSPIVTFWQKLSLNSCEAYPSCDSYCSDGTYVDVSSDGGTTWTVLTSYLCSSNTTVWNFQQLSLASYAGQQIKLRFRLNGPYGGADGWYVDDIKIRENEFVPASSDLALCTTQAAGGACNSADLCGKQCGPDLLGSKSLTCTAAKFVESACTFPAGADYSCYKVGAAAACATGTKAGQACTATACQACGATTGTGYLDASGAAKQGFCVCSKGVWSCGTTAEWPCYPQTTGAAVPASCN
jgi:hypothetical protein